MLEAAPALTVPYSKTCVFAETRTRDTSVHPIPHLPKAGCSPPCSPFLCTSVDGGAEGLLSEPLTQTTVHCHHTVGAEKERGFSNPHVQRHRSQKSGSAPPEETAVNTGCPLTPQVSLTVPSLQQGLFLMPINSAVLLDQQGVGVFLDTWFWRGPGRSGV